jgi:hypothetical protein
MRDHSVISGSKPMLMSCNSVQIRLTQPGAFPQHRYGSGLTRWSDLFPVSAAITGLVASWIVIQSWRIGASFATLLRMLGNVVVDVLLGAIPLFGNIIDMFVRTNQKNVQLLCVDLDQQGLFPSQVKPVDLDQPGCNEVRRITENRREM